MTTRLIHGRYGAYAAGCRCDRCVEYQRERVKKNRLDRIASGRLSHGTRSAYDAGCRCDECLAARSRAHRTSVLNRARRAA